MKLRARGFTLMEVMVAVAITALMGAIIASTFAQTVRAREVVEAEADHYRMVRAALGRISREVSSAFVSDRYDARRFRDQNDRPTNFIGEEDRLLFTSLAHQRLYTNARESDQMVVEYSLQSSRDSKRRGQQDLVRRMNPLLGTEPLDRGGREDVLFENVKGLEFAFWDSTRKEWDDEWDTRRLERKSQLPTRVRITVTTQDESKKDVRYITQARLPLNVEFGRFQ
ncbi:MAG: type II secretion system protein GspJ [Myxococcaceae bacterium]